MPPFDPFQFNLLIANYLALAILLPVVLWRRHRPVLEGVGLGERLGLVAAMLMGWLQQGRLSTAFIHENGHGYLLLEQLVDPSAELHVYGSGYVALFFPLFKLFAPHSELLIAGVSVLCFTTVLTAGLVVIRLFGPASGVLSALALSLSNTHLNHGMSESRFTVAMAFFMLGWWLALEARRTGRLDVDAPRHHAVWPPGRALGTGSVFY